MEDDPVDSMMSEAGGPTPVIREAPAIVDRPSGDRSTISPAKKPSVSTGDSSGSDELIKQRIRRITAELNLMPDSPAVSAIGARKRPDGTLDFSRAAIAFAPTQENGGTAETEALPGSLRMVDQLLQKTIEMDARASNKLAEEGKNTAELDGAIQRLEEEQSVMEIIIKHKAIDLATSNAPGNGGSDYERFVPTAREMTASEAYDILQDEIREWDQELGNDARITPEQRVVIETRLKAASRLGKKLSREGESGSTQTDGEARPVREGETEKNAGELAKVSREQGFGQLYGLVYPIDKTPGVGGYPGMGFVKGKDIIGSNTDYRELTGVLKPSNPWEFINSYDQTFRQAWIANKYHPTSNFMTKSFQGEHPEGDWTQFTYVMPTETPHETRPGVDVQLNVVVPPEIAKQIDKAIAEDPLFADAYFKALFPGAVGEDGGTHIKRVRATELVVVDRRDGGTGSPSVIQYPKPIEY